MHKDITQFLILIKKISFFEMDLSKNSLNNFKKLIM